MHLNRNYRILWSEARHEWIVASELASAGGKGKARGAVSKLLCAALVAGGLLAGVPEDASALSGSCGTGTSVNITTVLNGKCTAAVGDSITLSNSGKISVSSSSAILYSTSLGGATTTLDNSGTIQVGTASSGSKIATSVKITNDLSGTLTNSGNIKAFATSITSIGMHAYGVDIGGALSGTLTNNNTGTISATAKMTNTVLSSTRSIHVSAYGVRIGGALSSTLTNDGTISATAINNLNNTTSSTTPSLRVSAYGVSMGSLSSMLTNNGTISSTATNNGNNSNSNSAPLLVTAYGVNIAGALTNTGTLLNSSTGTISATATNNGTTATTGSIKVNAYGVNAGGALSGTLTNDGSITVTATNGSTVTKGNNSSSSIHVTAYGVNVVGALSGTLLNSSTGTISATATNNGNATNFAAASTSIKVAAFGVDIGSLSNTLTNDGSITATATNTGNAARKNISISATGVNVVGALSGTLKNSSTGTITATASNKTGTASRGSLSLFANGVMVGGTLSGTLTNDGTITATASNASSGGGSSATGINAHGMNIATLSGTLTNTGTISASVSGIFPLASSQAATGVLVSSMTGGTLDNSGTISATSSKGAVNAYSLKVAGSTGGVINNLAGGVLRGNILVAGAAVVNNAGTIEIPDTVATARIATALNNQASGLLLIGNGSTLTDPGGVQNAGTVDILNGKSATIAGNLTQLAGGKIKIGASSAASFGKLTVSGTADLTASGAFDVNVAGANTLAVGNTLTGVLTAGTLVVPTGGYVVTDNSLLFDFTGATNGAGKGVDLSIIAAAGGGGGGGAGTVLAAVQATGFTPGFGAAVVFDNLIAGGTTGDMSNVITALGTLSTQQQVSNAVALSGPLLTGGAQLAGLDITRGISRTLESHLSGMQGMASGDAFFGSGKLWIKPFGGFARQGDRNGASGFNADTFGLMVGMDKDVSDATSLAFAFGWGRSLLDSNNNFNSARVNAFQLAASGIYHLDADTFIRFSANGGINQNDGQRTIVFGGLSRLAQSSYNSWTGHAGLEAGRSFAVDEKMSLTPSLRVDYAVIRDNSYTETGAGALNLNVGSTTTDELLLGGDVKLGYALTDTAMFTASVGGAYDALQEQALITSSFAGAPGAAFITAGINPPRWLGRGGASLSFKAAGNIDVIAAYDAELRKNFYNQTASVKLVMVF